MKTREIKNQSPNDIMQFDAICDIFINDPIDLIEKIDAFPRYSSRQSLAKFFTKYELFKKILHTNGSIVECGVLHGAGLLAWAKLSSIFEPVNHTRKIIGFDTFEGFPDLNEKDTKKGNSSHFHQGGLSGLSYDRVQKAVDVYDINRPLNHIPKIEMIKGDICETAEKFVIDNPHLVVSLLYLDLDLYEPTKKALEIFYPLMPKGGIIVYDELNAKMFPGETIAVKDFFKLNSLRIERFPFDSYVSYSVIE